ncbi:MAG: FAD binding domain-containing protein [Deltaproteobacteria bacterium]|nr:FAD binding domain-containing protein [Deltaproteobacteria bacterium]
MLGRLPSFDYYRPATLDETLTAMERLNGNFCVLAGGTDLLVGMKERRGRHPALLDIKALPELAGIRADNGTLCLGATVTTRAIAQSPLVRERFPMLFQSMKLLGSMQIGNRATIGGNNFFIGPKKTIIEGELLAEVRIPTPPPSGRGIFYKLGPRNAPEDICIVSAAVYGVPDGGANGWKELRIALGAVAPTPIRARHAEERLKGQPLEPKLVEEAARIAADRDATPISDIRGSADYRREMVYVLVKRALEQIARDYPSAA